jgi:hypothetical protein
LPKNGRLFYLTFFWCSIQVVWFTVQWLFAEPLTVKCGFFMSRLTGLGMDNGSWLQVEPLNCEPLAQTRLPSGGQA